MECPCLVIAQEQAWKLVSRKGLARALDALRACQPGGPWNDGKQRQEG